MKKIVLRSSSSLWVCLIFRQRQLKTVCQRFGRSKRDFRQFGGSNETSDNSDAQMMPVDIPEYWVCDVEWYGDDL